MNKSVFGKIVENVRNHIRLKLVATGKSKNKSASVPNTIHQNNSKQESIYEDWYDYVKHIGIRLNYASKIRTTS